MCNVGTKSVCKELKITQGRVRNRNITWFPELVDKRELCIVHGVVLPACVNGFGAHSGKTAC